MLCNMLLRLMQGAGGTGEKAVFVAMCEDMTEQNTSGKFGICAF